MTTQVAKPSIEAAIKHACQQLFMADCAESIGLSYGDGPYSKERVNHHWEYRRQIRDMLELPAIPAYRKWEVNALETKAESSRSGGYFPEGSFYRLGLIMSGGISEENSAFFYRSCTYHFDKDMNFISTQFHWNDSDEVWQSVRPAIEVLFTNKTI